MQIPLPPCTSIASLTIERMRSVMWYLQMAEMTLGFSPDVERGHGHPAHRVHQVGRAADARERLLDPLEAADGRLELRADARVGAGGARGDLARGHRHGRQRDRAPGGQALHQHAPAGADLRGAADHPVDGDEDVLARGRAVHERAAERVVAPARVHAGVRGRDEGERDADVVLAAEELVRVEELEGEAQEGRHRGEGDVALLPGEADAEDFPALVQALADDAEVRDRGRVGARLGVGEREARDLLAPGEARQVVVLLRLACRSG